MPFLKVRKTPLSQFSSPAISITNEEAEAKLDEVRRIVLADRAIHEKGQRGFVSWVQAYSKHQASSIFRVGDIDWEDQGNTWGLLKLPKMPELKKWDGDKSLGIAMNWSTYEFKDKRREEARIKANADWQEAQATKHSEPQSRGKELKRAWSDKLDARDEREMRRNKKQKRRDREKWEQMTPAEREKQLELERMIDEVKARRVEEERHGEFEGFDD